MWQFRSPEIVYGEDALMRLRDLDAGRALIVTDPQLTKLGVVQHIKELLAETVSFCQIISHVASEPNVEMVETAREQMVTHRPEVILAVGGGSAMDVAKVAWFLYERSDVSLGEINPFTDFKPARSRLIAIPTTSGSGADVTMGAVITNAAARNKVTYYARDLQPNMTIVDPALTTTLPPRATADSGLDILTHAVEAYTNSYQNDFSDGLALQALRLVFRHLPNAYTNGDDLVAREHLHNAATMAGLAISNASVALAHPMAHVFGASFAYPHGRIVATFLPYTIEYTVNGGGTRYQDLARALGSQVKSERSGAATLVRLLRELFRRVSQPLSLAELGVEQDAFDQALDDLVLTTSTEPQLLTTLRTPDERDLERLYLASYRAETIDF